MNTIEQWMFARSLAGHDHGKLYLIARVGDGCVYLADGKIRTLSNLKKKKIRHIQAEYRIPELIREKLLQGCEIRDEDIRKVLKTKETIKCQKTM
ncbi:MAG TPA: 50S ribosomal protein L14 [Lachnospiraceae bacterium]|nr:50S ribosomal protein L14 [Lachnospiraceae bacterium]